MAKKVIEPRTDETLILAENLFKLTAEAMKPLAKFYSKTKNKEVHEPEPVSSTAKNVVNYLKAKPNAFGCNRPDVVALLNLLTGEPIGDMIAKLAAGVDSEEDPAFIAAFNDAVVAGCAFRMVEDDETILLNGVDGDHLYLRNGNEIGSVTFDAICFNHAGEVRPATVTEIAAFIDIMTLKIFKKNVVIL